MNFLQRVLWFSPLRFLVQSRVLDQAWLDGYLTACVEIKRERALMLSALDRLSSKRSTAFFATIPTLTVLAIETLDAWDAGYERAITMHRLGFKPSGGPRIGAKLARRDYFPGFDDFIRIALDGGVSRDPRVYVTKHGAMLYARHRYQALGRILYEDYRQKLSLMRAAHIKAVDEECAGCAASYPDDCICPKSKSEVRFINRRERAC